MDIYNTYKDIELEKYSHFILDTLNQITDRDTDILMYLIDRTIYDYMIINYDINYKLPTRT